MKKKLSSLLDLTTSKFEHLNEKSSLIRGSPELLLIVLAPIISVRAQKFVAHYRHLSRVKRVKRIQRTRLILHLAGTLQDVFLNIGVFY